MAERPAKRIKVEPPQGQKRGSVDDLAEKFYKNMRMGRPGCVDVLERFIRKTRGPTDDRVENIAYIWGTGGRPENFMEFLADIFAEQPIDAETNDFVMSVVPEEMDFTLEGLAVLQTRAKSEFKNQDIALPSFRDRITCAIKDAQGNVVLQVCCFKFAPRTEEEQDMILEVRSARQAWMRSNPGIPTVENSDANEENDY